MIRNSVILAAIILLAAGVSAQQPESLQQAKILSIQTGKPILLEFVHED